MSTKLAHERLPGRGASPPIAVASTEPRIFGVVPALLALGLGTWGVLLGIVLLALGRLPAGLTVLLIGAVLFGFAIDSARRWPTSRIARGSIRAVDAVGPRVGLARVFAGSWSDATREVVRLRGELRALREERDREQFELGGAAARDDMEEVVSRREQFVLLERRIEELEQEMTAAVAAARERVARKRASIKGTKPLAVEEVDPSGRKTTATVPRRPDSA